ncbi:MAG: hypothetical protein FWD27_03410 [Coriobacteriia bacterium]|nr:hypothetical protein [Coriobacteriia bacterium]
MNKPVEINLKIDKREREDGKTQLTVTVPAAIVGDVMKGSAYLLASQNKIDIGEVAPEEVEAFVKEIVGEAQYNAFVDYYVMAAMAPYAITQKNIEPIMEPELSPVGKLSAGEDFTFIAVVSPKPYFELSSYDPVTVKLPQITITEEEIDDQILKLSQQRAELVADEGAEVSQGREVRFAFKTAYKDNDEPIVQLTDERRAYQLGQGYMPKEFDEQLMGMKSGESKSFDFELPMPPGPDGLSGKTRTATTTVDLIQVERRVVPSITDAWVEKNLPDAKNVEGLRKMLHSEGMRFKQKEQEDMKMFAVASTLAQRFTGNIPDEIYEHMQSEMLFNLKEQLKSNGMTIEQLAQNMGMDMQQFNMTSMMQVRETLRQGFSLDALARHHKFTVTEEDIAEALKRMSPGYEQRARAEFEGSGRMYMLREAAMRTKANLWLVETATFEIE